MVSVADVINGRYAHVVVAQALAHGTTDRKVPSSIPAAAGSRAFFSFSSLSYHSISGAS